MRAVSILDSPFLAFPPGLPAEAGSRERAAAGQWPAWAMASRGNRTVTRSDLHILAVLAGLAAIQVVAFRAALRLPRLILVGAALAGSFLAAVPILLVVLLETRLLPRALEPLVVAPPMHWMMRSPFHPILAGTALVTAAGAAWLGRAFAQLKSSSRRRSLLRLLTGLAHYLATGLFLAGLSVLLLGFMGEDPGPQELRRLERQAPGR